MKKWESIVDREDEEWADNGYHAFIIFEYFDISVWCFEGKWKSRLDRVDGARTAVKRGKDKKTEQEAKMEAIRLAMKVLRDLAKDLRCDVIGDGYFY